MTPHAAHLTAGHLDEATWERLAARTLDGPAREQALGHLFACRRCTAVYRSLLALEAGARAAGLGAGPSPRRRWLAAGLGALAACTALVALWSAPTERLEQPSALRGAQGAAVLLLPPSLGASAPSLGWQPWAAATRYRISVFTYDGLVVWTREVATSPVRWPDEAPRAPGSYRYRVEALRGGAVVATSPLAPLVFAP